MSLRSQQEARDDDRSDDYATEVRCGLVSERPASSYVRQPLDPDKQAALNAALAQVDRCFGSGRAETEARYAARQATVVKASLYMASAA